MKPYPTDSGDIKNHISALNYTEHNQKQRTLENYFIDQEPPSIDAERLKKFEEDARWAELGGLILQANFAAAELELANGYAAIIATTSEIPADTPDNMLKIMQDNPFGPATYEAYEEYSALVTASLEQLETSLAPEEYDAFYKELLERYDLGPRNADGVYLCNNDNVREEGYVHIPNVAKEINRIVGEVSAIQK